MRRPVAGCAGWRRLCDWVTERGTFRSSSSNHNTTAVDKLLEMVAVCRDDAHWMIATCHAINNPARFVTIFGECVAWPR